MLVRVQPERVLDLEERRVARTPTSGARRAEARVRRQKPRNLTMKLLFDAWASGEDTVSAAVDQLIEWRTRPRRRSRRTSPNPPILVFTWGRSAFFDAYLEIGRRAVHDVQARTARRCARP